MKIGNVNSPVSPHKAIAEEKKPNNNTTGTTRSNQTVTPATTERQIPRAATKERSSKTLSQRHIAAESSSGNSELKRRNAMPRSHTAITSENGPFLTAPPTQEATLDDKALCKKAEALLKECGAKDTKVHRKLIAILAKAKTTAASNERKPTVQTGKKPAKIKPSKNPLKQIAKAILAEKGKVEPRHRAMLGKISGDLEGLEKAVRDIEKISDKKDNSVKFEKTRVLKLLREQTYAYKIPAIRKNLPILVNSIQATIVTDKPEGVFRISGEETAVKEMQQLTSNTDAKTVAVDLENLGGIHDIAATYKAWIGVVTPFDYKSIQKFQEAKLTPEVAFETAFKEMSTEDKQLFNDMYMLTDLCIVHKESTSMGLTSTAIVFAPRLFKDLDKDPTYPTNVKFSQSFFEKGYELYKDGKLT